MIRHLCCMFLVVVSCVLGVVCLCCVCVCVSVCCLYFVSVPRVTVLPRNCKMTVGEVRKLIDDAVFTCVKPTRPPPLPSRIPMAEKHGPLEIPTPLPGIQAET